jgi:VanZ family protein
LVYRFKLVSVACLVLTYWAAGVYPFSWGLPYITYENAVQRSSEGAWLFLKPGIARTTTPPEWLSEAIEHSTLKILLEIRPASQQQSGPARILTVSQDPYYRNLTIAQEGAALVVRLRTPLTSLNGTPAFHIEDVFTHLQWWRIEILIGSDEIQIWINRVSRLSVSLPARAFSVWANNYGFALGNEMTFDRPWLGEIRRAEITVGQKTLDFAGEDLLTISKRYSVPRSNCLVQVIPLSCSELDQRRVLDWLLNLIGFVPFGFLTARVFPHRRVILKATLAAFVLSLSIEATQIFLPARFPSSEDVLLNIIGAALGAILAGKILPARIICNFAAPFK